MGMIRRTTAQSYRTTLVMLSFTLALVATLVAVQFLSAEEIELSAADLTGSHKTVDRAQATAGSPLNYTIVISNSGDTTARVLLTDSLPLSLTFQSITAPSGSSFISEGYGEKNGVISMTGLLGGQGMATLQFSALLTDTAMAGQTITNTVEISGTGILITRTVGTLVVTEPPTTTTFLPLILRPLATPILASTRPNSGNSWTVSWSGYFTGTTGFELQESQVPDFASSTDFSYPGTTNSAVFAHSSSFRNIYYYRARAIAGPLISPWSNVIAVVGAYLDDFNDSSSNWALRRVSYLERSILRYGTGSESGNLILIVDDRYDWELASPLMPAPQLPYAIEYRSRVHDWSNLVSGGASFGGDWNGGSCPDLSGPYTVYTNDHCFNHFYNINTIWFGGLKTLFERVDYLYYCPSCGGSQLKRLTNDSNSWFEAPHSNVDPNGWNTWRIEVRSDGIKLFVNGFQYGASSDTSWVNSPYFGTFASTYEYKPSIWFFDYYKVTPLDN